MVIDGNRDSPVDPVVDALDETVDEPLKLHPSLPNRADLTISAAGLELDGTHVAGHTVIYSGTTFRLGFEAMMIV